MKIVNDPADVRRAVDQARADGHSIGFVPTMGALHDGHATLLGQAKSVNGFVVASIFVNPLQFNDPRDLASYPTTATQDEAICSEQGVDLIYRPSVADMYPLGFDTRVEPGALAEVLEGHHRPGHFSGMATVVLKLFNIVDPDDTYFGKKDFQQLAIVRRMATDLNLKVRVHGIDTVREADGLALSSRNSKLSVSARKAAVALSAALFEVRRRVSQGADPFEATMSQRSSIVGTTDIDVEYFDLVDASTMRTPTPDSEHLVLLVAANVGGVRLIDNVEIFLGNN